MRRVVPVALLALAALRMGTLSAAVGSIVRAKAPAAAAHLPPPSGAPARRDLDAVLPPSEFVDAPFPGSAPNRTRVVYPEYPERSRGIVMIVPVASEAPSGRPSRRASPPDLHGFGWGGSAGFAYPVDQPELDALVAFHGDAPTPESDHGRINAPVLDPYSGGGQATATKPQSPAAAAGGAFEVLVRHGVTLFLKTSTACHATC